MSVCAPVVVQSWQLWGRRTVCPLCSPDVELCILFFVLKSSAGVYSKIVGVQGVEVILLEEEQASTCCESGVAGRFSCGRAVLKRRTRVWYEDPAFFLAGPGLV